MGLYDKASVNKEESRIAIVRFSHSDIERHPAVAEVLKYYGED
jgi:phosphate starvation-inducible protein PhoH